MRKRNYIFVTLINLFAFSHLNAQDTLILNDGTEMDVKVVEIGENTISFRKDENISGPMYSMNLARVFLAIYKNKKREIFKTVSEDLNLQNLESATNEKTHSLKDNVFEVRLIETVNIPDKRKRSITVSGTIGVYLHGQVFANMSLLATQRNDITLSFEKLNAAYLRNSSISFSINSEKLRNILFQKYEKESGYGFGWALPPEFFSGSSSCSVALLEQKPANKELLGFGGITSKKYTLKDCSSNEMKLLSVALVWLEINFNVEK